MNISNAFLDPPKPGGNNFGKTEEGENKDNDEDFYKTTDSEEDDFYKTEDQNNDHGNDHRNDHGNEIPSHGEKVPHDHKYGFMPHDHEMIPGPDGKMVPGIKFPDIPHGHDNGDHRHLNQTPINQNESHVSDTNDNIHLKEWIPDYGNEHMGKISTKEGYWNDDGEWIPYENHLIPHPEHELTLKDGEVIPHHENELTLSHGEGIPHEHELIPNDGHGIPHDHDTVPYDDDTVPHDHESVPNNGEGIPHDHESVPCYTVGGPNSGKHCVFPFIWNEKMFNGKFII